MRGFDVAFRPGLGTKSCLGDTLLRSLCFKLTLWILEEHYYYSYTKTWILNSIFSKTVKNTSQVKKEKKEKKIDASGPFRLDTQERRT